MTSAPSKSTRQTCVALSNGVEMPVLALGTAPLLTGDDDSSGFHPLNSFSGFLPEQACRSVHAALHGGGEEAADADADEDAAAVKAPVHIDTALFYRTHGHIRQVLCDAFATGKKKRSDVFLTTKVFHPHHTFGTDALGHCMPADPGCELTRDEVYRLVRRQFQQSLDECGVGYFDLVLLHWPGRKHPETTAAINAEHRLAAWNALEDCYSRGWARAIGVSNFSERHLEELRAMNEAAKQKAREDANDANAKALEAIRPHVNQIEASVFLQYSDILEYCNSHGIVAAAYSPLGRGVTRVTTNPVVRGIAARHGKDAGQVAMKYLFAKGYGCVVFWSTDPGRIASNYELHDFELEESEIAALDGLNRSDGTGTWGLIPPYDVP